MADIDFQPIDTDTPPSKAPADSAGRIDFQPIEAGPGVSGGQGPEGSADPFERFGGKAITNDTSVPEAYRKVRETIERPFLAAPVVSTETTPEADLEAIAAFHKVNPDELKKYASLFGAHREQPEYLSEAAGVIGRGPGLGIPQFLAKKMQTDPGMRSALDDVRDLSDKRRSFAQGVGEQIIPGSIVGKIGKGVLGHALTGAAVGGIYGVTGSKEGEEGKGAAGGAVLGGVLGGSIGALDHLISPKAVLTPAELEAVRTRQLDLQKGIEQVAASTKDSESLIKSLGTGEKSALTPAESGTLVREQLGEDATKSYLDPATQEGKSIREKLGEGATDQDVVNHLSDQIVEDRYKGFAESLTRGDRPKDLETALGNIEEYANRQGVDHTAQRYEQYVEGQQAQKFIEESGARAKDTPGFFGDWANKLSDSQYVLRHLDDKYGSRSEDAMRAINQANNRYSFPREEARKDLDVLFRQADKAGLDSTIRNSDKLYTALDTGMTTGLTPQEVSTLDNFKGYFEKWRDFANGVVKSKDPLVNPLSIPKLENYVPHIPKQIDEIIPIVEAKTQEALEKLSEATGRDIQEIAQLSKLEYQAALRDGTLKDLTDFAKWGDINTSPPKTAQDLDRKLYDQLYTRQGNIGLESKARAAMARTGEIPDFILEKDLYKLADKYALNTLKHLYLRKPLELMGTEAKKLEAIGASSEAEYVRKMVQDAMGIRAGTAAEAFMRLKVNSGRTFDKLIEKAGGSQTINGTILETAKHLPDMMYSVIRNMYPNILGYWNIRAAMQHTVTGLTRMAPELGGAYGYKNVVRSMFTTAANFSRNIHLAESLGNIPREFTRSGEQALAEGIMRSGAIKTTNDGYQKLARAGMALFQAGERWNRALVVGVADNMTKDLMRGSGEATQALRNFPYSVRKEVMLSHAAGDTAGVFTAIARHVNDTTVFSYNRAAMFELGRTLGPMLSTFSKWPTSIYGEARYDLLSRGISRGSAKIFQRLALPYLGLRLADYALFDMSLTDKKDSEMSDRQKKIFGAKGLSKMAPIGALSEAASGKIFTPPAVDLLVNDFLKPVAEGEPSKLSKGFETLLRYSVPGSGLLRFVTDDLVTLATGRAPEGKTLMERAANGIDRATK